MNQQPSDADFEAIVRTRLGQYAAMAPTDVRATSDVGLEPISPPRTSRRRAVGIGASVVALLGGLTLTGIAATGGDDGGANTPEDAVREFVQAIENRDALGALDLLDPGESEVLVNTVTAFISEAERIGLTSGKVDANAVAGATVAFDGLVVSTDQVATDIAVVTIGAGTADVSFDLAQLPFADQIDAQLDPAAVADAGAQVDFAQQPIRLATVERDGTWYVSVGYSIAEAARSGADLPFPVESGVAAVGFDSPEAAVTAFWSRMAAFDFPGAIATAAPGEADALARYSSLWLPDVMTDVAELSASGVSITADDMTFIVTGDGNRRRVEPLTYSVSGTLAAADPDDGFPVYDPTAPTLVYTENGSGFYLLDPGVALPTDFDDLDVTNEFPPEFEDGSQSYNTATLYPDGSAEGFWADPVDETVKEEPRPFRYEFADGCTTASGALLEDALRYGPATEGVDDLGDGRYRSCLDGSVTSSLSVFSLILVGQQGAIAPQLPTIETVEIDGQWYISPVGSIAAQLLDTIAEIDDGEVLSIDSPLGIFLYGTDRATFERQVIGRPVIDLGPACADLVIGDGDGNVTALADDLPFAEVNDCVQSEGYWAMYDDDFAAESVETVGGDVVETVEPVEPVETVAEDVVFLPTDPSTPDD